MKRSEDIARGRRKHETSRCATMVSNPMENRRETWVSGKSVANERLVPVYDACLRVVDSESWQNIEG